MAVIFGLDFGTTNTLLSYITEQEEKVIHYTTLKRKAVKAITIEMEKV